MTREANSDGCGCDLTGGLTEAEFLNSRRRFMEQATTIMLGSVSLSILPVSLAQSDDKSAGGMLGATGQIPLFGFMVDTEKCTGSGKCLTACRVENNVPEGYARTWVERYIVYKDGTVEVAAIPETGYYGSDVPIVDPEKVERSYFVPKLCNHCRDAPCNQVCPTHASITSPAGVELVDPELCIGCGYCVQACPYGVRFINPDTNNADKCTWCYHRIMKGEQPACVEACPTGARVFGRLDDPTSEISKRLAKLPTSVLKEHLGTHPKLYYIDLPQEVI